MKTNTNTTGTQDNDFNLFPPQVLTNTNTEVTYGYDPASPDGDYSALSIKIGKKVYSFVGEEAEAIDQYVHQKTIEACISSFKKARKYFPYPMNERDPMWTEEWLKIINNEIAELQASLNTEEEKR